MPLKNYQDIVARAFSGYCHKQRINGEIQTTTTLVVTTDNSGSQRCGDTKALITPYPSGVTGYILSAIKSLNCSTSSLTCVIGKMVDLGSLNIGTNTFTDGSQMPTYTALGVSKQFASPIFIEVTTALNATPGSITVTYVDQDGNTAEAAASQNLTGSAVANSVGFVRFNANDWGAIDITDATQSGGTSPSGVIKFWGMVPMYMGPVVSNTAQIGINHNNLTDSISAFRFANGDVIGCFILFSTVTKAMEGWLNFVGDN